MKKSLYLALICGLISCGEKTVNNTSDSTASLPPAAVDTVAMETAAEQTIMTWADSLVKRYVSLSDAPLVKMSANDPNLSWVWDDIRDTDSATYYICNVGVSVDDPEGGRNFSNCQWLWIDTTSRQIYEYDLANEVLIKWTK